MVHTAPKRVGEIKSIYIKNKYCALSWYKYKAFTKKRNARNGKLQTKLYGLEFPMGKYFEFIVLVWVGRCFLQYLFIQIGLG
jgi:hypothetical protein